MSCKRVRKFMNDNLLPAMYKTYLQAYEQPNNHPSIEEFLEDFGISKNGVSHTTTWRWLHELGYEFKERKKSYFTDRHENKENVSYREEFIAKYFEAELNTHRWVHLKEDVARRMD